MTSGEGPPVTIRRTVDIAVPSLAGRTFTVYELKARINPTLCATSDCEHESMRTLRDRRIVPDREVTLGPVASDGSLDRVARKGGWTRVHWTNWRVGRIERGLRALLAVEEAAKVFSAVSMAADREARSYTQGHWFHELERARLNPYERVAENAGGLMDDLPSELALVDRLEDEARRARSWLLDRLRSRREEQRFWWLDRARAYVRAWLRGEQLPNHITRHAYRILQPRFDKLKSAKPNYPDRPWSEVRFGWPDRTFDPLAEALTDHLVATGSPKGRYEINVAADTLGVGPGGREMMNQRLLEHVYLFGEGSATVDPDTCAVREGATLRAPVDIENDSLFERGVLRRV